VTEIFAVIAPIFFTAALGFLWSYFKQPYQADFVSKLVMQIGCPCLIIATLSETKISTEDFSQIALLTLLGLFGFYLFNRLFIAWMKDDKRTYLSALTFANTGNMGAPICLYAFGEQALALSLSLFMVTSLLHFSLGVAWTSRQSALTTLLKAPVFYSTIVAVTMVLADLSLPKPVYNMLSLVGDMAIPLMLFSLGVSLHSLKSADLRKSTVYALARLLSGFGIGFLLCEIFALSGIMRGVVLIQASMPSAVFNYLIASSAKQEPEKVAAIVVISTLISFICLPFLLWYVMPTT